MHLSQIKRQGLTGPLHDKSELIAEFHQLFSFCLALTQEVNMGWDDVENTIPAKTVKTNLPIPIVLTTHRYIVS